MGNLAHLHGNREKPRERCDSLLICSIVSAEKARRIKPHMTLLNLAIMVSSLKHLVLSLYADTVY